MVEKLPRDMDEGELRYHCAALYAEIEELQAALRECVQNNEACFFNHYGENPEGAPLPEYILRARVLVPYEPAPGTAV